MSNISLTDGHIDNAEHCVSCGAELYTTNFISATRCEDCGKTFYVIED